MPTSDEDQFLDDEEEEEVEKIKNSEKRKTTKKFAVSAEVYGDYNRLSKYEPKLIEKTEE